MSEKRPERQSFLERPLLDVASHNTDIVQPGLSGFDLSPKRTASPQMKKSWQQGVNLEN